MGGLTPRRVAHLTVVHPRFDTRIFFKECRSLARSGYAVTLIVADGLGEEEREGIRILDAGAARGRLDRMWHVTRRVHDLAVALDAEVYHLHDPELIPVGLKLKRLGKFVLFDAHEDLPEQLLAKPYLNKPSRRLLSLFFAVYERWACRRFDGIIAATPHIRDKFAGINPRAVNVNNFPIRDELAADTTDWLHKQPQVAYVGSIAQGRGIAEMVRAMAMVRGDVRLQLGGHLGEPELERALANEPGWDRVDVLGLLGRAEVREVLQRVVAGLVTLPPASNYREALPVKMFEYMSAGVPVIASHFPLWRYIIEGNACGLCVDPLNPGEIAEAINYLVDNPDQAERMGRNGRRAMVARYDWCTEEQKLLEMYAAMSLPPAAPLTV